MDWQALKERAGVYADRGFEQLLLVLGSGGACTLSYGTGIFPKNFTDLFLQANRGVEWLDENPVIYQLEGRIAGVEIMDTLRQGNRGLLGMNLAAVQVDTGSGTQTVPYFGSLGYSQHIGKPADYRLSVVGWWNKNFWMQLNDKNGVMLSPAALEEHMRAYKALH